MGGHDIGVVIERLDKLFHLEKASYAKFLACRGASAQQLLDLLQDLLDYDVDAATINRRRLFQALIRLSANSKLYPRCLTLTGLQQERLMAGGSFGDVYKGLLGDQSVAIKMMRVFEESDIDALLKEFGREALIWRQLSHPNLLPFFGLYYFQQRLCLVSPWMENGHMRAFLKKKVYDTDYLLSLILDVALGLEHLHDTGVVHSDLKGDNIFVTPSGRACIADFGLSSIITSVSSIQFTHSSKPTQGGTTRYQAPELLRGGHNDTLSDIYAFAGVAYEILTGTPPFPDLRTDGAVVTAVLRGDRPLQPDSCSGTPSLDGLWKLLQDCWEEQPARRPTAAQIVQRLMSPDIQATKMQSAPDWDESFTSRFRRYLASRRPLPSFSKFERIIFGDASNVDKSQRPASRPFLLPASDIKSAPSQKGN
ncbi:kinase-like domain-containing protein [Mycena metata]|uniref:Kinase-like domain-containing protein n=1 Tax=Mycena metata TaxID=1033252 RepID=A0AAD7IDK0_9AGAR|nr:kinase-like domain-containing protein [Mycena metata]